MCKKFIYAITCLLTATTALAAPVEFETEDAHVIVVRPIDLWSGDLSAAENILDNYKSRKVNYFVKTEDDILYRGSPTVFQGIPDHPITKGVEKKMDELNFQLAHSLAHN